MDQAKKLSTGDTAVNVPKTKQAEIVDDIMDQARHSSLLVIRPALSRNQNKQKQGDEDMDQTRNSNGDTVLERTAVSVTSSANLPLK